jgi:predicted nuclease of predicted toxin-antitoxin system
VKLLLDQNLSPRLIQALVDLYPGSVHVRDIGLREAPDEAVWIHAARNGLTIVSKDADFHQRSFVLGHPPKVIWVRRPNCSTASIESILRIHRADLDTFDRDAEASFLILE